MERQEEPMVRLLLPNIIIEDILEELVNVIRCRKYVEDTADDYKILTIICKNEKEIENALYIVNSVLNKHPIVKELYNVVIQ